MSLRQRWFIAGCLLLAYGAREAFGGTIYTASLTGDQEFPNPVETEAFGTATFELSDDQTVFTYNIQIFGFDIGGIRTPGDTSDDMTRMHIHAVPDDRPPEENGGVVFGILDPQHDMGRNLTIVDGVSGPILFEGEWDAADVPNGAQPLASQLGALMSGRLYVNVHSVDFPAGEIRGQIMLIPEPATVALACLAALGVCTTRRWALTESVLKVGR